MNNGDRNGTAEAQSTALLFEVSLRTSKPLFHYERLKMSPEKNKLHSKDTSDTIRNI